MSTGHCQLVNVNLDLTRNRLGSMIERQFEPSRKSVPTTIGPVPTTIISINRLFKQDTIDPSLSVANVASLYKKGMRKT